MSTHEDKGYEVGYGKPPSAHQFKPGQSGNPKGRRKGAKSLDGHLDTVLRQKITINEAQGPRQVSKLEAVAMRLVETALKGDLKAMQFLLSREAGRDAVDGDDLLALSPTEAQILAELLEGKDPFAV